MLRRCGLSYLYWLIFFVRTFSVSILSLSSAWAVQTVLLLVTRPALLRQPLQVHNGLCRTTWPLTTTISFFFLPPGSPSPKP
ncbi:hypothetical protein K438DRAFT_677970 [Mycena galopus ATCC 62051]|nr:hypothetical protein K438DRAFT_677970 [Mycena galopus ATCC 62051]